MLLLRRSKANTRHVPGQAQLQHSMAMSRHHTRGAHGCCTHLPFLRRGALTYKRAVSVRSLVSCLPLPTLEPRVHLEERPAGHLPRDPAKPLAQCQQG